jgi:plasmid stabilization system protein ParE
VTQYQIKAEPSVDADVEAAFDWYEGKQEGLGREFIELRAVYLRIVEGPLKYAELRSGIRRALIRRFPHALYFAIDEAVVVVLVVVLAVLHAARDPAEWQRRVE